MTISGQPSRTAIFLQDACYQHRFIRSNDLSAIVERPERLRALKIGLSAAISRLEELCATLPSNLSAQATSVAGDAGDELSDALQKLKLLQDVKVDVVDIIKSGATLDILNNDAVKFVHGDINGDVYLMNLASWAKESAEKIRNEGSEVPMHLPQGDLYLCPESLNAIQGALGTVCEAVDSVMKGAQNSLTNDPNGHSSNGAAGSNVRNAFVAIRPPGHHCGEDSPSGFCFVNNVMVAAAHAHLKYGVMKVVILDIDLHHGNGTQALAWQINEETYRQKLEAESSEDSLAKPSLQVYYGSIHDILSFPCEDGNTAMVQAASASIHGAHGQHIENIHLQTYESDEDFWENLYPMHYARLLRKAGTFVADASSDNVLVFISCGFDACEHEYPSMSRHNRRVPTSFYHRFAVEARHFADKYANGKLISVLEGGYSDRALISGGMAHLTGLFDIQQPDTKVDEGWWKVENLVSLEKATKKRRGGKLSVPGPGEKWLERTISIFQSIDTVITPSPSRTNAPLPPSSMTLRERKPPSAAGTPGTSPRPHGTKEKVREAETGKEAGLVLPKLQSLDDVARTFENLQLGKQGEVVEETSPSTPAEPKKLPRVILRVKETGVDI